MAFQTDIRDAATWKTEVIDTAGVLQVVELYQSWCGPSKPIVSLLKKLYYDYGDMGLKFFTVAVDTISQLEKYRGHCQPVFLLYRDGKVLQEVVGLQAPALTTLISTLSEPEARKAL